MTTNKILQLTAAAAIATSLAGLPTTALASVEDLITKNGCGGCHKQDKKIFGPGFKEIAAKYKGDATAPDSLLASLQKGSTGKWSNNRAMPAQQAPEAELKELVTWILAQ